MRSRHDVRPGKRTFQRLRAENLRLRRRQHELQRTIRSLESRVTTDALTGLHNRAWFDQACAAEIARAARYRTPFALLMCDIDHFKDVNDRHGHEAGDRVLRELAKLLRARVRASDSVARWGGEEFMILAPHTGARGAWRVAEALRRTIAAHPFPDVGHLTCSFGVAGLRPKDGLESLSRRADAALYRAKQRGRNRTELSSEAGKTGKQGSHAMKKKHATTKKPTTKKKTVPGASPDYDGTRLIERPDGFYWQSKDGTRESGPFGTRLEAITAMDLADDESLEVGETLEEAEEELGISAWTDPDTGELAEDHVHRLENH